MYVAEKINMFKKTQMLLGLYIALNWKDNIDFNILLRTKLQL